MKKFIVIALLLLLPFLSFGQDGGINRGLISGPNFIPSLIGTTTWGSGSAFTWTFDAGSTDPTFAFGSGTVVFGGGVYTFPNVNINATLGTEKITWTAAGWNEDGVTWTVAGTPVVITHVTGNTTAITSTLASAIIAGTTYKVVITYAQVAGTCTYTLGGVSGSSIATSATSTSITDYITAATTVQMIITPLTTSNIVISSISIKALTDATGDLTIDGNLIVRSPATFYGGMNVYQLIDFDNTNFNTKLGYQAGLNITSGVQYDTFVGYQAGYSGLIGGTDAALWNTGIGSGTLHFNTTGHSNTVVGVDSLGVNTTGYYNSTVGVDTLLHNTTGYRNTAIGVAALYMNVDGYSNSALGVYSLYFNTSGYFNSGVGDQALCSNTTGYYNSAIGGVAGRFITDGSTPNQTSNNSVYIGYDTRPLADNDTNEIIIGASAIGLGSNSVVLGNTSITKTILRGNIGIGTATPIGKQHTVLSATIPALFGGDLIKNVTGVTISDAIPSHLSKDTNIDTNIAAGDMVIVQSGTNATAGVYTVTAVADNDITIDRKAVTGACTNAVVDFVKDVIGFFPTDGTNGQRLAGYSHQNKPLQIGGHVLVATTGYTSEDVIIGNVLRVDASLKKFVATGEIQAPIFTVGDLGGYYTVQGISNGAFTPANSYYMDDQTGVGISIGRVTGAFAGLYVGYDGNVAVGTVTTSELFTLGEIKTITEAVTDGYSAALRLDPGYTAATAQTVTRHNYIDVQNVSVAGVGPAAVTDSAVLRFDNVAGTHNALAIPGIVAVTIGLGPTGSTAGTPVGWMKINVNGTLRYMPYW